MAAESAFESMDVAPDRVYEEPRRLEPSLTLIAENRLEAYATLRFGWLCS